MTDTVKVTMPGFDSTDQDVTVSMVVSWDDVITMLHDNQLLYDNETVSQFTATHSGIKFNIETVNNNQHDPLKVQ